MKSLHFKIRAKNSNRTSSLWAVETGLGLQGRSRCWLWENHLIPRGLSFPISEMGPMAPVHLGGCWRPDELMC